VLSSSVELASSVTMEFPLECCANCGSRGSVRVVDTEVRRTLFLLGGGSETTLRLPVPYCPTCEVTAARTPNGPLAKLLLSLLLSMALMLVLSIAAATTGRALIPVEDPGTFYLTLLVVSVGLVFAGYRLRRPRGTQTSWYQPVRLRKLRQRFVDGTITGIVIGFTCPAYLRCFAAANAEGIARGTVSAVAERRA
jgi:hypothetical protein